MKSIKALALLVTMLVFLGTVQGKTKKLEVPAIFGTASYVYVEATQGDDLKPGLFPEDRQAIYDVEESLRDWKRYSLTARRGEADLVFVVRKGRVAGVQPHVGIGSPTQPGQSGQPGSNPGQGPGQPRSGPGVGVDSDFGTPDDMLRVYMLNSDGKLIGPIWSREMDGGLDAPTVRLMQQLRAAVEQAYPPQPPPPPKQP